MTGRTLLAAALLSLSGCGTRDVLFSVYQEDDGCWEPVRVERPARYWPDGGPDIETECVNAAGDCVRFDGAGIDDPWLGACDECPPSAGSAPNC